MEPGRFFYFDTGKVPTWKKWWEERPDINTHWLLWLMYPDIHFDDYSPAVLGYIRDKRMPLPLDSTTMIELLNKLHISEQIYGLKR